MQAHDYSIVSVPPCEWAAYKLLLTPTIRTSESKVACLVSMR